MGVAITIRDVPDEVRDVLAARAARADMSLDEYLRVILIEAAAHSPAEDVIRRARARVVCDGWALVMLLFDSGPDGWATDALTSPLGP